MKDLSKGKMGFGPNSWGWFRILIPYGIRFYYPSISHDISYSKGGIEDNRFIADWILYYSMLDKCDTLFQERIAYIYFKLIRAFGWIYFKYTITYKTND